MLKSVNWIWSKSCLYRYFCKFLSNFFLNIEFVVQLDCTAIICFVNGPKSADLQYFNIFDLIFRASLLYVHAED